MQYLGLMRSVIVINLHKNQKIDEHVPPACTKCFTKKEMNDESARNASRSRMNACVQPRFARAIRSYLVGEREKGRILFEQTSYKTFVENFLKGIAWSEN